MLRSRWFTLVILCAAALMVILDGTIVTVALPVIQADLGFTPATLSWVMDSYLIAFGGLLLLSGRLGDLLGRKHMLLSGLAVFTLASLVCGLATGPGMLTCRSACSPRSRGGGCWPRTRASGCGRARTRSVPSW